MRLLTWNIHSCRGLDGRVSVERVASAIAELAADVVVLNEVRRTPALNQPRELARRLGMPTAFQRNLVTPGLRFGNAVMVRGRIAVYRHVPLPGGREPRGLLLVRVEADGHPFWVGATHLGLSAPIRIAQKARILEALPVREPLVVAGDFNEAPAALGELGRRLHVVAPDPTFPAGAPARAIDFVLHSDDWAAQRVEVSPTIASDHRPVLVELARLA